MPIAVESKLGPYLVTGKVGAGGMGEVWRAKDTRLGREVAIKLLPESVAGDPERLRRFSQEARTIGALSHPNVVSVFDVGEQDGVPYLVTELLSGETLRERMAGRPMPPRRATEIATAIARGLGAAHEAGIVHRDLKPENVFVTKDGTVKILDFGLAKLMRSDGASGEGPPTMAMSSETAPGTLLGTVGYMSPEQVRSESIDARSDIFALGAILYEMLAGHRAFSGNSSVEILSAILRDDPAEMPRESGAPPIPAALERIVRRCLEKNPAARYQSARDLAFHLEEVAGVSSATSVSGPLPAPAGLPGKPSRRGLLAPLAFLAIATAGFAGYALARRKAPTAPRFHRVTFRSGSVQSARFAPDGRTIVYSAHWTGSPPDVYTTRLGSAESRPLGLVDTAVLAVSQSSELLLQRTSGVLARVPLDGGAPRDFAANIVAADWSADGRDVAVITGDGHRDELQWPIGSPQPHDASHIPRDGVRISPDGTEIAFPWWRRGEAGVAIQRKGEPPKPIAGGFGSISGVAWSPDAREVWISGRTDGGEAGVFAVPRSGGVPEILLSVPTPVRIEDVAADGRLLVVETRSHTGVAAVVHGETRDLSWLDHSRFLDVSPDGSLVLFDELGEGGGPQHSVYIRKTDGSPAVRLGDGMASAFSLDGSSVVGILLGRNTPSHRILLPVGLGAPKTLPDGPIEIQTLAVWHPDGKRILFPGGTLNGPTQLFSQDVATGEVRCLSTGKRWNVGSSFITISPDGTRVLGADPKGEPRIFPLDREEDQPVPHLSPGDVPIGWAGNSAIAMLRRTTGDSVGEIVRVDIATGKRSTLARLAPPDGGGAATISDAKLSADGSVIGFGFWRDLSTAYVVELGHR